MKKPNALLANIGSVSARTGSSTATKYSTDRPHFEKPTLLENDVNQKNNKELPLSGFKNVSLPPQTTQSNPVKKDEARQREQREADSNTVITQAKNIDRNSNSVRKPYVEQPLQTTRSTSSAESKSKVSSKRPPTKTLHLGKLAAFDSKIESSKTK